MKRMKEIGIVSKSEWFATLFMKLPCPVYKCLMILPLRCPYANKICSDRGRRPGDSRYEFLVTGPTNFLKYEI